MKEEFVILFPDLRGENARGSFGQLLVKLYPQARIVPILNGASKERLEMVAEKLSAPFEPVIARGDGLLNALRTGYAHVFGKYGSLPVVRIDTDEHPPSFIPTLIETAVRLKAVVVGDLSFGPGTLRHGSLDEFTNVSLFPNLYRHFTGGRITLSGAYGFQAFAPTIGPSVLIEAERIVREAEREVGRSFTWGWDGAMILGALGAHLPVEVHAVPADVMRDRSADKITRQLEDTLAICCAASRLFRLGETMPHSRLNIDAEE